MSERRSLQRGRTFLGGKIIFNTGRSILDCTVRNLSEGGACVEVQDAAGLPSDIHLLVAGDSEPRRCHAVWRSGRRIGLSFEKDPAQNTVTDRTAKAPDDDRGTGLLRDEMLALRASLDEIRIGIVLLDGELRAQFINRAFRKMWRLPDSKADGKPAFVALMYHGRNTRAYKIPEKELDKYVAERVALVKDGDPAPIDLRLSNGETIRMQCAVLPNGGRMLSYMYVTDIMARSDELEVLRAALDQASDGIILLDAGLNAQFMNRAVRQLWKVSDEQAESRPPYSQLVGDARFTGTYGVAEAELEGFIARRLAIVRAGDSTPQDLQTSDGRHVRSTCAVLPGGGRMLTYCDVSDLIRGAKQLEKRANVDSLTGISNRHHFLQRAEAEWSRFQRYLRPLSLLMLDIDHFKSVNDRFGHAIGDLALAKVAAACQEERRAADIVARIGGEEFGLLLPETDLDQAYVVAERLRKRIEAESIQAHDTGFEVTVSIGAASASLSMSGVAALMHAADQALYGAKALGRNRVVRFQAVACPPLRQAAE